MIGDSTLCSFRKAGIVRLFVEREHEYHHRGSIFILSMKGRIITDRRQDSPERDVRIYLRRYRVDPGHFYIRDGSLEKNPIAEEMKSIREEIESKLYPGTIRIDIILAVSVSRH